MKLKNRSLVIVLLALIFLVFLAFRSYNLPQRIDFGWDQERDAFAVANMVENLRPTLLGPRVLSDSGFYLPPYFFYLILPFYLVAGLSPFATVYFLIAYNIAFFAAAYFVFKKIFSRAFAFIFLSFWAVHPLALSMDIIPWNPLLIPLTLIAVIFLLAKYYKEKTRLILFVVGLTFGIGISFHMQFLLLSPLALPFLLDRKFDIKKFVTKALIVMSGVFVSFLPLFLFDLRHDFLNLGLIQNFVSGQSAGVSWSSILLVWEYAVSDMLTLSPNRLISIVFFFFVSASLFLGVIKNTRLKRKIFTGFLLTFILAPIFFAIYKGKTSEYYFNYLFVISIFTFSYVVVFLADKLSGVKKLVLIITTLLILGRLGLESYRSYRLNPTSLYNKDRAIAHLSELTKGRSDFGVSFSTPINEDTGYRYLLHYYKVDHSDNPDLTLIRIIVPPNEEATFKFGGVGLHVPEHYLDMIESETKE